ncbi:uncharacterized protein MICPUCDRAFT_19691, partial [Micromonas pusilla CCMP1545]
LQVVRAIRNRGHFAARLDPLGRSLGPLREGYEAMETSYLGLHDVDPDRKFYFGNEWWTLNEVLTRLQTIYCGTLTAEFHHIASARKKAWLQATLEGETEGKGHWVSARDRREVLRRLISADALERLLARSFPSAKRFGVEGAETLIPGLQAVVDAAATHGVESIVMGVAHRGRLNILNNVFRKPVGAICAEMRSEGTSSFNVGDVRYHLGTRTVVRVPERPDEEAGGGEMELSMAPNPSHLEAVNAVVTGMVRSKQMRRDARRGGRSRTAQGAVMGLIIHGDAAFCGLGANAEVMQLQDLPDYTTGGTVHIVVNNQIGFTTVPRRARSSPHPSDVAKGYGAPIFHVNGDDPEAVVRACRLAVAYRAECRADVVVNLVCYRRYGHNEQDDPSITLPLRSKAIENHPRVVDVFARKLVAAGDIGEEEVERWRRETDEKFRAEHAGAAAHVESPEDWVVSSWKRPVDPVNPRARVTGVPLSLLRASYHKNSLFPRDFEPHPHVRKLLSQRKAMVDEQTGVDWGTAELLAFGTLLTHDGEGEIENNGSSEGVTDTKGDPKPHCHVRLSGQDVERGTFNHRHSVLYCARSSRGHVPLNNLGLGPQDAFMVSNSPLSEHAILGFEYGFSVDAGPSALVLWEAQFGDFANNAQCVVDQFITTGEAKWGQRSGLVLLLPHGYDGQGPDHSNARPERWLAAANDDADTLPGRSPKDYFHALRRQALASHLKPMVVFTPKFLLHHRPCQSSLSDFGPGTRFHAVIGDGDDGDNTKNNASSDGVTKENHSTRDDRDVRRVVVCTGKMFYALQQARKRRGLEKEIALVRVEQLAPFPHGALASRLGKYPDAEIVWCQEEPKNMGWWPFVQPRINTAVRDLLLGGGGGRTARYVGRPSTASPATGSQSIHALEMKSIVQEALRGVTEFPTKYAGPYGGGGGGG